MKPPGTMVNVRPNRLMYRYSRHRGQSRRSAIGLYESGGPPDYVAKPGLVAGLALRQWSATRPMMTNGKIRQVFELLEIAALIEVFEMTETQMTVTDPQQHGASLFLLPVHGLLAGDQCQGARWGSQMMQGFAGQKFANRGAQDGNDHRPFWSRRLARRPEVPFHAPPLLSCCS